MGFIKKIKYNLSFLTRIPVRVDIESYDNIAKAFWLSPIVGWIIGIIPAIFSLILFKFFPDLVVGFIILGMLIYLTGAHHLDGLLDLGDGLMVRGNAEKKISVMHDVAIGAGGFAMGLVVMVLTGITIAFNKPNIIMALVLSEVCAKNAMVAACSLGKSAETKTITPFIENNSKKHFFYSLCISSLIIFFTLMLNGYYKILIEDFPTLTQFFIEINSISGTSCGILGTYCIFLVSLFVPLLIILRVANKNFNGLTGDCIGALHEITRVFFLTMFLFFFPI